MGTTENIKFVNREYLLKQFKNFNDTVLFVKETQNVTIPKSYKKTSNSSDVGAILVDSANKEEIAKSIADIQEGEYVIEIPEHQEEQDILVPKYVTKEEFDALNDKISEASFNYDPEKTYNMGSLVIYQNHIYTPKEDGVTGDWDGEKWSIPVAACEQTLVKEDSNIDFENWK